MKHYTLLIGFMLSAVMVIGQSGARFSVQISTDSILMGNSFKVSFTLSNAEGSNFKAPELGTYFKVVSGPNTSTSMSFMTGQMSQSVT
ncbi:MAG: BatD family protein [Bacteroidota bacterium]